MCLAQLRGRSVVVAVLNGRHHAPCRVWDARTGRLLTEFEVSFPQYGAVGDPRLVALPALGEGAVLLTTDEVVVEIYDDYPSNRAYLAVHDLASGELRCRLDGGSASDLGTTNRGPVMVFTDGLRLAAARPPGGDLLTEMRPGFRPGMAAVGVISGRDVVVSGEYSGRSAVMWDLARPDPIAVIQAPPLRDVAIVADTVVLATQEGLYAAGLPGLAGDASG